MKNIGGFLDFLFPRTCAMCGERLTVGEKEVCARCVMQLHRLRYDGDGHHGYIERLFWAKIPIEKATSMFYYEGGEARRLLHSIKYRNRPRAGEELAKVFAREMLDEDFFDEVDGIVAVPLHWRRRLRRGYNQSDYIARGISSITQIPVLRNVIKRTVNNSTQTHLNHFQRQENVKDIFRLTRPDMVLGKHILLVDDVMTTGATILSCAQELASIPDVSISVFTLALANQPVDFAVYENTPMEYEFHVRPTTPQKDASADSSELDLPY